MIDQVGSRHFLACAGSTGPHRCARCAVVHLVGEAALSQPHRKQRTTAARHQGRVRAGGVEKDVTLVETDDAGDEIDAAYHAKYGRRYPGIVPAIVAPEARAATLKLVPR